MAPPPHVSASRRRRGGRAALVGVVVVAVALGATGLVGVGEGAATGNETSVDRRPHPTTPLLSARRVPTLVGDAVARDRLTATTSQLVAGAAPQTCAAVADDRGPVTAFGAEQALVPASTMKLATSAVAFEVLGPDYRWTTSVAAAGPPVEGVVPGDLVLVGGGDPLLVTSGFAAGLPAAGSRATSSLEALADAVVASGVRRVEGGVVGNDARFDAERAVPTWSPSYLDGATVGSLGALRVNRGLTNWVEEPQRPGARGDAGDPAVLAAATFATLLRQRGVDVRAGGGVGPVPEGAATLAAIDSPPLLDVVAGEQCLFGSNRCSVSAARCFPGI